MDHAEDMCECLRQFLQSQAAEFNSMIRAVTGQDVVTGNGLTAPTLPSHAGPPSMTNPQMLALFVMGLILLFLLAVPSRRSPRHPDAKPSSGADFDDDHPGPDLLR
ncbi:Uncharacterized protein PBTT_08942 [Plasmodiophora brassicae]